MRQLPINPVHWRVSTLVRLEAEDIHELASRAVGTLTCFRLILGRCLLALQDSKAYKCYGCSSVIHYACTKLGICPRLARTCRRVAQALEGLPQLSLAAEAGSIEWSKLREIVRKASPITEEYWLKLASSKSYAEIEALVRRAPQGSIPGEVDEEGRSYRTELRCAVTPAVGAMLEHARRCYSLEAGEAVTTAQVVEKALASYIAGREVSDKVLEKVRDQANRDLLAQQARRLPVVAEARELAASMGLLKLEEEREVELNCRAHADAESALRPEASEGKECLEVAPEIPESGSAAGNASEAQSVGVNGGEEFASVTALEAPGPAAERDGEGANSHIRQLLADALGCTQEEHLADIADCGSHKEHLPGLAGWRNNRLRFNPKSRVPSKAQRQELLRRDGWCCRTPGCPHQMWLHLHHLHEYAKGGATTPDNLLALCAGCHRNLHDGLLQLTQDADGRLVFSDAQGRRLDRQMDLELATWLDFHLGWSGREYDSHWIRANKDEWAVYQTAG